MASKSNDRGNVRAAYRSSGSQAPAAMRSVVLWIEPSKIILFKAIIESYDNLATLRTEDPTRHHLRLYFGPESETDVMDLLAAVSDRFSMRHIG
jgi:hypothetical protein